jgi:hypothetical protein
MASDLRIASVEMTSRISSLRMILPDGTEKAAELGCATRIWTLPLCV